MKLIAEITDLDFNPHYKSPEEPVKYRLRRAARAVLVDPKTKKIALMFVSKDNIYKLPGGGIDSGESIESALGRELLEETSCKGKVSSELGLIIEVCDEIQLIQFSYCYITTLTEFNDTLNLTDYEKDLGFELIWVPIAKAIKLVSSKDEQDYFYKFMQKRHLTALNKAIGSI